MAAELLKYRPRFILVSDLDWTMVDHDDQQHTSLRRFNDLWSKQFAKDSLLVFSTGRSHALYTELKGHVPLRDPDILICSVGTEIFFEATGAQPVADAQWVERLNNGWSRQQVVDIAASFQGLKLQEESEQRPHKVSFEVLLKGPEAEQLVSDVAVQLKSHRQPVNLIYSGGADLDILPAGASKGKGLEFLLEQVSQLVGLPSDGVMVCGDSGNDIELFAVPNARGCMVSNAHLELKRWCDSHASPNLYQASQRCAGGILEALAYFQLPSQ